MDINFITHHVFIAPAGHRNIFLAYGTAVPVINCKLLYTFNSVVCFFFVNQFDGLKNDQAECIKDSLFVNLCIAYICRYTM